MTLNDADESPRISITHQGRVSHVSPGDHVDIEFPDSGVSGRLAGVDIAPGGTPFSLIVTHDGKMPEQEYSAEVGPLRDPPRRLWGWGELSDTIAMVQERGYVVQEIEDYNAGLKREYERARRDIEQRMASDASPENACEAVTDEPEGIDRTAAERVLRRLLRASTARVQELERMTQIQENELNGVQTELVQRRRDGDRLRELNQGLSDKMDELLQAQVNEGKKTVVINNAAPAPIRSRTTVQAGPITVQYEELS